MFWKFSLTLQYCVQQQAKLKSNSGKAQSKRLLGKETAAWLRVEKLSQTSLPFSCKGLFFSQKLIYYRPIILSSFFSFHKKKKKKDIQILLLFSFATTCFNAGPTCVLCRNPSSNLGRREKKQVGSNKTGSSARSKWWSHSKLWNLERLWRTKLPDTPWTSSFYHTPSCWNHVYCFGFFSLWIQLLHTCDLN